VVLLEHDKSRVMRVCDVVHVLDLGTVIAVGPPEQIRRDEAVVAAYLGAT
jgi:branched-chain amino acid transport system ATP-binding protein